MKVNNFATIAAMLAVPAFVVSCNAQDYSTPEGLAKGALATMKPLTEAANACTKGNFAPLEKAVKEHEVALEKITAARKAMPPEQKAEFSKLVQEGALKDEFAKAQEAFGKAVVRLLFECDMKEDDPLLKKLEAFVN